MWCSRVKGELLNLVEFDFLVFDGECKSPLTHYDP
jgi:hypothetical protein